MTELSLDESRTKGGFVASRVQINDVRVHRVTAVLKDPPQADLPLSYHLQPAIAVNYDVGENAFIVEAEYELTIRQLRVIPEEGETPDEDDFRLLAEVTVMIAGLFLLDMDEEDRVPESDEVEAFGRSTGMFALHPYAREFIATLTARMGLPTLTIGVLRMDTGEVSEPL